MSRIHKSRASKAFEKKGLTRREFLKDRVFPTVTAMTMSPFLEGLIRNQAAMASGSPVSGFIPFAHIHLSGGWGFNGTFAGLDQAGNLISRNTMTKHGIQMDGVRPDGSSFAGFADPTPNMISSMGGRLYPTSVSGFSAGLMAAMPTAIANTRIFIYHTESDDDNTAGNPSGISPLFTLTGFKGNYAGILGRENSDSGNQTLALASDPATQRYTVNQVRDFINSISFSRSLTHSSNAQQEIAAAVRDLASTRIGRLDTDNAQIVRNATSQAAAEFVSKSVPPPQSVIDAMNPTKDADFQSVFNLTDTSTAGILNSANSDIIQGMMVKAALDGNSGPIAFHVSGYDYHDQAQGDAGNQPGTNTRNRIAGQMVGRFLEVAAKKGKPLAIWLTTDGGLASKPDFDVNTPSDNQYSGDRRQYSGAALLVYIPGSVPPQLHTNIGNVDATSGQVNNKAITGDLKMASGHVYYNLALLAGKASETETILTLAGYSRPQIEALRTMPGLFNLS